MARLSTPDAFAGLDHWVVVHLRDSADLAGAAAYYQRRREVDVVEPNYGVRLTQAPVVRQPDDFEFDRLWNLRNTGQTGGTRGADIGAVDAWNLSVGHARVRVAIVDTGTDYFHPDLAANIWVNDEVPGNGVDDDGNGYVDDVHGFDFISRDGDPWDDHGHGTHVAGVVGARGDNGVGITGVCWDVTLMVVKAFDDTGNSTVAQVVEALRYAAENGAQVINASWGLPDRSRALRDAVTAAQRAGILVIAAAGNENSDALFYPASFEGVVSVASTDADDQRSRFSNHGPQVDVAAPGDLIFSTLPDVRYDLFSGTSMAAPHVSGVAALVWARHPAFTWFDVAEILRNSVDPVRSDKPIGSGRINAARAVGVRAPLAQVALKLPELLRGRVDVLGSATGTNFARRWLDYGRGSAPSEWTMIEASVEPVADGVLVGAFDTTVLSEGLYTFRLRAETVQGDVSAVQQERMVANVRIDSPGHNDVLRAGETLLIRGAVFGAGRSYRVDYGRGAQPTQWSGDGLTLVAEGAGEGNEPRVLAAWDTGKVPADGFYTLRLTGYAGGEQVGQHLVRMLYLDSHLRPGWPISLPMGGEFPTNDLRHVTLADLDGDRAQELILLDAGERDGRAARLLVLSGDGRERWSRTLTSGDPTYDIPVVGDLLGPGQPAIVVDAGEAGELLALDGRGNALPGQWPVRLPVAGLGKALGDLDGDGRMEIVGLSEQTVTRGGAEVHLLLVYQADGTLRQSWEIPACDEAVEVEPGRRIPALANLDDEPDLEVVVVSGCQQVSVYKLGRPSYPLWSTWVEGRLIASPVVGDLNDDGRNEIVIGSYDRMGKRSALYALDDKGVYLAGWPVLQGESFGMPAALADLDRDGTLEVIVTGWFSHQLHVLHHHGFHAVGWPVGPLQKSSIQSSPVIGDVDGDQEPDVVLASPGYLYLALTLDDLSYAGGVRAWNREGQSIRFRGHASSLVIENSSGAWHKSAPVALGDVDGDGLLDLALCSLQDRTYGLSGESVGRKKRSSLYVWGTDVQKDDATLLWPTFQGNAAHSGYQAPIPPPNQPPVLSPLPDQTVAPGRGFVALELDGYVDDPNDGPGRLDWLIAGARNLRATVTKDRLLEVEPIDPNWTGAETVRLTVTDPGGLQHSVTATYQVLVGYVPPTAREDVFSTPEDAPYDIDVLENDVDPGGQPLQILQVSRPKHGRLTRLPAGGLRYVPKGDYHGDDRFTYTVSNGRGGLAIASVRVTVLPVEDPPVAEEDHVITDEDALVRLLPLANDSDPDGTPIRLVSWSEPAHGKLRLGGESELEYVPEADWSGSERLTYRIADPRGLEVEGSIRLLVKAVNDPPVASDQNIRLRRNGAIDVIFTATDTENDPLTFAVVQPPKEGELFAYPTLGNYIPRKSFAGTDSFTYRVSDGRSDGPIVTVHLEVADENNPPDVEPVALATKPGRPLNIELSARDLDGDPVTFEVRTRPEHGTLEGADHRYVFRPEPGFLGQDRLEYWARDQQGGESSGTVEITVTDRNTAPVATDQSVNVTPNQPLTLKLSAVDAENDPVTLLVIEAPLHGALSGEPPDLTYLPKTNFIGSDRIVFRANDGEEAGPNGTVTLVIGRSNAPAVVTNQTVLVPKDTETTIVLDAVDPDFDSLAVPILKGPRHGRLHGRGTVFYYRPDPTFVGQDEFTYRAWDDHAFSGIAKVSIVVEAAPSPGRPAIASLRRNSDGTWRLAVTAPSGATCDLFVSKDLVAWTLLQSGVASDGEIEFIDAATKMPETGVRFYRVVARLPSP